MYVCLCKRVTERELAEVVEAGACTVMEVAGACGATTDCGACRETVETHLQAARPETGQEAA